MVRQSALALSTLLVGGCLNPWSPMGGSSSSSTTWLEDSSSGDSTAAEDSTGDGSTTAGAHSDSSAMSASSGTGDSTTAPTICGDGVVDEPEEECDDANDDDDDLCDNTCFRQRIVFATSTPFTGGYLDGLAHADNLCMQWANKAGLSNPWSFTAWLSDSQEDARDRIYPGRGRYVRVDGTVVAHGADQFSSGSLLAPINVDEHGQTVIGAAWTGTLADGTAAPSATHCEDWTNDLYLIMDGYYGFVDYTDGFWTHDPDVQTNPTSCAHEFYLYCIEGK